MEKISGNGIGLFYRNRGLVVDCVCVWCWVMEANEQAGCSGQMSRGATHGGGTDTHACDWDPDEKMGMDMREEKGTCKEKGKSVNEKGK